MLKTYNEFVNESKVNEGFFGKVLNSLKDWVAKPLNDFLKDIENKDNTDDVINSLKTYISGTSKGIDGALEKIESKEQLSSYLKQSIMGVYTALKGVQATQKVGKAYFDEIFKKADKNLVKVMGSKSNKIKPSLDNYVDNYLIPNLEKIGGVNKMSEKFLFEINNDGIQDVEYEEIKDDESGKEEQKLDKEIDKTKDEVKEGDKVSDGMKTVVKKWLLNIFAPILNSKSKGTQPSDGNIEIDGEVAIPTVDKSGVKVSVMRDLVKNATLDDIMKLRNVVASRQGIKSEGDMKNKWPLGR